MRPVGAVLGLAPLAPGLQEGNISKLGRAAGRASRRRVRRVLRGIQATIDARLWGKCGEGVENGFIVIHALSTRSAQADPPQARSQDA